MLVSPLRYPGGKARLLPFFAQLIQDNALFNCSYHEPYAGGAGLALKLLSGGFVRDIVLNDIDEAVFAFWDSVLYKNAEFCARIENAPLTIDEWYKQRAVWQGKDLGDKLSLGFATFYLNRTNRSGIIEGAGPIGGYAQEGVWRLDARFNRAKQIASVRALAGYQDRIQIRNEDAVPFIERSLLTADSLTYLDPPYYVKGSKLYRNSYVHEDHEEICALVDRHRSTNWVVSYDDVPAIRGIYCNYEPITYALNYSAGRAGQGQEVVYLSDALRAPLIEGFELAAE